MLRAYAVADVREVEDAAMAALPEGELMARAARGLAEVVRARLTQRGGSRVVALVGAGNNGGDALYAASLLASSGAEVAALTGPAPAHPGGLRAATEAGVRLLPAGQPWAQVLEAADVVVDGITGIGGSAGLRAEAREWVVAIPEHAYVVAVDLPSGTDPAGLIGTADCVFADETVTFGAPKPVHLLPAGEPTVGRLTVVDIGLDFAGRTPVVERLTPSDVPALWPVPGPVDDKYSRGVVGSVTGSTAYPGAAILSVLGALGAGPGMVRYLGPRSVAELVHYHAPESVAALGRVQAWVLGSGIDTDDTQAEDQVSRVVDALYDDVPVVVDAGGLDVVGPRSAPMVLTPHAGELARLLTRLRLAPPGATEVTRADVVAAPLAHATLAADHFRCVVLLKGSTTLVVSPSASGVPARSQADAPAWLATAGAGDVLGGVIGTLLASGLDPVDAASLGALVHGQAAHRANPGGPVRAFELAAQIPTTVATLLAHR
ncbi:MAG: bifunctional ADP-dependent NAD(P)H-hydrate dehydratase/NAD(P)H-hydrate epimerase [Dermatophilaceae bacterium]